MRPNTSTEVADRVVERRRAVALANHYREAEGLSIAQIAGRLGRSRATVKAYFYDPTGEKARAVKARYQGVCRGCGAYTQPRNGKGDAYAYCKACHPGEIKRRWTSERVLKAMGDWRLRYGRLPSSYDWSRTHARRRGGDALDRLATEVWPAASAVTTVFGSWAIARAAASEYDGVASPTSQPRVSEAPASSGSNGFALPKPRESTAKSTNQEGAPTGRELSDLQAFPSLATITARYSGR